MSNPTPPTPTEQELLEHARTWEQRQQQQKPVPTLNVEHEFAVEEYGVPLVSQMSPKEVVRHFSGYLQTLKDR